MLKSVSISSQNKPGGQAVPCVHHAVSKVILAQVVLKMNFKDFGLCGRLSWLNCQLLIACYYRIVTSHINDYDDDGDGH